DQRYVDGTGPAARISPRVSPALAPVNGVREVEAVPGKKGGRIGSAHSVPDAQSKLAHARAAQHRGGQGLMAALSEIPYRVRAGSHQVVEGQRGPCTVSKDSVGLLDAPASLRVANEVVGRAELADVSNTPQQI